MIKSLKSKLATLLGPPPTERRALVALPFEPFNLASSATVQTVQSALRSAEAGVTRDLFALYRDITISGSHIQAELSKRKLALLGETPAILPADKENKEDIGAALACAHMLAQCENWIDGLTHLLDSCLWPVSIVEKIYRPFDSDRDTLPEGCPPIQFLLKRLEPVNYTLLAFLPAFGYASTSLQSGEALLASADQWEPDLRFYGTTNGAISYDFSQSYAPEPIRHIVHRGHLLVGVRDNWGGPMRAVLFWSLLASLGRDWFARFMERYGTPFLVGKTDTSIADSINFLRNALSLSTRIGGLVVDHETEIDLKEAMTAGGADAHEKFLNVCNREISKVIVGQTSSEAHSTGLGSGVSKQQEQVREDIRLFDQIKLGETIRKQLFAPFLAHNNIPGQPPKIIWGGITAGDAVSLGDTLLKLAQAGLEPTDEALPTISERIGFELQRKALPPPGVPAPGTPNALQRFAAANIHPLPLGEGRGEGHPSDAIASRKAAILGAAYRGALAPIRAIILHSGSEEEALRNMQLFFSDWSPTKVNQITEEALQLCAAAGAAEAK